MRAHFVRQNFANTFSLTDSQVVLDAALENFSRDTLDFKSISGMLAGSFAFKASNLFLASFCSQLLTRNLFLKSVAFQNSLRATSLGLEVAVFRAISAGSSQVFQGPEFFRDYLSFGILKSLGVFTQKQNLVFIHFSQAAGMVAGHTLASALGLSPVSHENIFSQLLHAESMNIKLSMGMGLLGRVLPSIHLLERDLDFQNSLRISSLSHVRSVQIPCEVMSAHNERAVLICERFALHDEEEAEFLAEGNTPYAPLARNALGALGRVRSSGRLDFTENDLSLLETYGARQGEIGLAILLKHRSIIPEMEAFFRRVRDADEGVILDVISSEKDPCKIPRKLFERQWRDMGPFTDVLRGKVIVSCPRRAQRLVDKLLILRGEKIGLRKLRRSDGGILEAWDVEDPTNLLVGYTRGMQYFALRRMKIVFELRGEDGDLYPYELQLMTRYFDRWQEIQRYLVKENKISSPTDWAILDNYCNAVAEWLSQIEQGQNVRMIPQFHQGSFFRALYPDLSSYIDRMEEFVEEVEQEFFGDEV